VQATVFHATRDVRVETVPDPTIIAPTDALVRVVNAAICGSDLWFYRGINEWQPGWRTGHEYTGVVEAVGAAVTGVKPGDFVIAPFSYSDGSCEFCDEGLFTSCPHLGFWGGSGGNDGGQGEFVRVPYADAVLVVVPADVAAQPGKRAALLALTDVMGTGFHGALSAGAGPGRIVAVIGDGAVGLCAVQSAKVLGAERIIAVGHHAGRLQIARDFGATDVIDSAAPDATDAVREMTKGGAHAVVEAVGNQDTMDFATTVVRSGGKICFVGVPATIKTLDFGRLFMDNVSVRGGIAPVRQYIPRLLDDLAANRIDPAPVFSLRLPLAQSPAGYAAMDERRAIKVILDVGAA
jgi:threonine dehydrogenase-like Zn-dependent dehydrogenase